MNNCVTLIHSRTFQRLQHGFQIYKCTNSVESRGLPIVMQNKMSAFNRLWIPLVQKNQQRRDLAILNALEEFPHAVQQSK